ncbi:RFX DNA-binding domain-containing protein [Xylariaceae sp. FL0594]|nr:RFX DNA-binding domain-containing protein [Xylariaceae sp. FL0594]
MEMEHQPPADTVSMSQQHPRRRAPSRASTASIHSIATQPNHERSLSLPLNATFQEQWPTNEHGVISQSREMQVNAPQMGSQMPSEEMMLRQGQQIPLNQSFSVPPSMHTGSAMSFSQAQMLQHNMSIDQYGTGAGSFTDADSQLMDRDEMDDGDLAETSRQGAQRTGSSRTSANNELEMRQLYQANRDRKLEEVAKELHGNERGPNSERTRQVFAMLWISQVCSKGKGSVPRGRVYANYASRCATERITVLNPASFGKLVRVLFPGLKTRRLGVRGESKYHYVNFSLIEDQPELKEPVNQPTLPIQNQSHIAQSFATNQSQASNLSIAKVSLPSPQTIQTSGRPTPTTTMASLAQSVYNQPDVHSLGQLASSTGKTRLHLAFPREGDEIFDESQPLILPSIEPFLPGGTDPDSAKSLAALYRSHCTSLVECIRYCKQKTFFHLYTSFQGTLTMPVQKLFAHPDLAQWIEQCDFVLYQRMVRIVGGLTLQVVPKPVIDTLRSVSERLVSHIRDSFQGQPKHVVQAKEAPAALFAALLDRALRVNLTAHAAANMWSNTANRDHMYMDWITMVRIRKVAECVPHQGMDDLVQVLLDEMRALLDPVNVEWEFENLTLYGEVAQRNGQVAPMGAVKESTPHMMFDRWVRFLRSLPGRFPYATAANIVWCVQRVGTEVMRDLTIAQAKSFAAWWVTKCWIDEMVAFLAEKGGFMQSTCSMPLPGEPNRSLSAPLDSTNMAQPPHRHQTGSAASDSPRVPNAQAQPDRARFPPQPDVQDALQSANPDDSGIGIRTPEEDFHMDKFDKFGFPTSQAEGLPSLDLEHASP